MLSAVHGHESNIFVPGVLRFHLHVCQEGGHPPVAWLVEEKKHSIFFWFVIKQIKYLLFCLKINNFMVP